MSHDSRWRRIEDIYHAALERDESERPAFLKAACGDDDTLRREVESLLAEGTGEDFLTAPALELAGRELAGAGDVLIGRQLGPYRILSLLGAGGMGEVYRARDTKLERDVAIKVLPSAVSNNPDRVTRFAREARLLAALNHPNIAAIHGLQESDGISAIVLELVEGETLADRIARGPIAVGDATAIARQIIDGLEAAHENGIIHRDLKPSNIKLRPDGTVKILDFGLAKALAPMPGVGDTGRLHVSSVTQVGVVTGTPTYMSPEQAQGRPVDERTDVWAFGCVFYEMLTCTPAFGGKDVGEILAAVIAAEPAWDALPRDMSPSVRVFLKRCLSKDVKQRVSDIHVVRLALEGAFETDSVPTTGPAVAMHSSRRSWRIAGIAAALLLIAGLGVWGVVRATTNVPLVSRLSISLPAGQRAVVDNIAHVLAVSPSGSHVVFAANGGLWLRALDTLEPSVVPGTESSNPHTPFFSPDGQWIGFYAEATKELKRVAVSGGQPIVIASIDRPFGAAWRTAGLILYGRGADGIWQVGAANGTTEQVIAVAEGEEAHSPQVLPDGRVLFTLKPRGVSSWDDAQIVVQARGSMKPDVLIQRGRDARYLPTGHLVYASSDELLAATFDVEAGRIMAGQASLVRGVEDPYLPFTDATPYAVADNGTLAYLPRRPAEANVRLRVVWVARDGSEEPLPLELDCFCWVRVAPDGTRILSYTSEAIVVSDIVRPSWTPIVSDRFSNSSPVWSRNGDYVVFRSNRTGPSGLFRTRADRTAEVEPLATIDGSLLTSPGGWTPDGKRLVFTYGDQIHPRLGLLHMDRVGRDEQPWEPLIDRAYDASSSSLSPRGDWIAYNSYYSGAYHVYIDRFPNIGDPKRVSTAAGGGGRPVWSANGRELFYQRGDGAMMAVRVETTPTLDYDDPVVLFESNGYGVGPLPAGGASRAWDVAPDGRFLMTKGFPTPLSTDSIVTILNWHEELKRLVPTK